jgi:hypothetical protein
MQTATLLPVFEGLRIESVAAEPARIVLRVSTCAATAPCPGCSHLSWRVHSHYQRTLSDLPWNTVSVRIHLHARKFFCDQPECGYRVFTEPVPELAARYARKTCRLQAALTLLCLALGGEAGARVAQGLGLSVCADTLLDHVRKAATSTHIPTRCAY